VSVLHVVRTLASSLWTTLAVSLVVAAGAVAAAVRFFDLTPGGGIALYFVIWWTVLFAVLPFGARSQADEGEIAAGTDPGAPTAPALREKAILTSLAAAVVLLSVAAILPLAGL
jgi:predicted secreted protein